MGGHNLKKVGNNTHSNTRPVRCGVLLENWSFEFQNIKGRQFQFTET